MSDLEQGTGGVLPVPEIQLPPGLDTEDWEGGARGGGKVRLVRSHAIRDSASPPPPGCVVVSPPPPDTGNMSTVSSEEIGDQTGGDTVSGTDSGRGDTDTPEGEVYTDSTGTDLTQFIINTINKNSKDRVLMLKLEQEMSSLVRDPKKTHHKFPHMSSYHRMLVHRVAAYFGLDHNVDQSGNCVIVNKTKNTRLPEMKFKDHINIGSLGEEGPSDQPKRLILKRENCSCDSGDRQSDASSRRSKSIEEREEEYEKARKRIFNEMMRADKSGQVVMGGEKLVLHSDRQLHCLASTKGANQARSFDMRDTLSGSADRPAVSKSFSFGGYPAPQHLEPRKSGGSRGSPHPPALPRGQVVWAVTDVSTVPSGAVLINPGSGTPYLNSDGSVYLFDPANPPRLECPPHPHGHTTPDLGVNDQLAKLSLDPDSVSVGSLGSQCSSVGVPPPPPPVQQQQQQPTTQWMVPGVSLARLPHTPAPYILVNQVSSVPLPQYMPYLSPHPSPGPTPQPPTRPLLFSLHRTPPQALVLFLQACSSVLTRAQLTALLDSFLGPASPQLVGGVWQFLDQSGVWADLLSLPPDTPTTNRVPVQIYFENEDMAGATVQGLRNLGFLALDPSVE